MEEHLVDPKEFVKAGNATFTLLNSETGNRFTFKVKKHDEKDLWFVLLLNGPDNVHHFCYMGTIFGDGNFSLTKKSMLTNEAKSFKVFSWLVNMLNAGKALPECVKVFHENKCGRCGRKLTVPESVESGFGPECITKM
tara:strand:- start:36 stop:449 length:414 start_codon:yes stop_codon:yes gene_type:complete